MSVPRTDFPVPFTAKVKAIVSSRYDDNTRPCSWDSRVSGVDVVQDEDGDTLRLFSDGGQSPPQPGWEIVLIERVDKDCFRWTLYGLPNSESAGGSRA